MQQMNPTFIERHLLPLIEKIFTDVSRGLKPYHKNLILQGRLSPEERYVFENDYFGGKNVASNIIPFTRVEEKPEREIFIATLEKFVRTAAADPVDRWKFLVPVKDPKNENVFFWPANVKKNLFLMAYGMAQTFEKNRISGLIQRKLQSGQITKEQANREQKLNERGLLMLIKNPGSKDFDGYMGMREVRSGQRYTSYRAGMSAEAREAIARGNKEPGKLLPGAAYGEDQFSVEEKSGTAEDMTTEFQHRRGIAVKAQLEEQGFVVTGDIEFDEKGHATCRVLNGDDELAVSVDTNIPLSDELNFEFQFLNGENFGKRFALAESQLESAFHKRDGSLRKAAAVYNFLSSQDDFVDNRPPGKTPEELRESLEKPFVPKAKMRLQEKPVAKPEPRPEMRPETFALPLVKPQLQPQATQKPEQPQAPKEGRSPLAGRKMIVARKPAVKIEKARELPVLAKKAELERRRKLQQQKGLRVPPAPLATRPSTPGARPQPTKKKKWPRRLLAGGVITASVAIPFGSVLFS